MREQIDPWILFWQDTTYAAENYLNAIEGALNGDVTALISGYTKAVEAYDNSKDHGFDYVGAVQYARAGTYAVQPCVDAMADYVAAQASLVAGGAGESVARVSADGLSVYESYSLDKIIDGNESTQAWLTGTRSDQGIDAGNSFTVTYAPAKTVEQITLVEGDNDKLAGGVIEYQVEGSSEWVEAGATTGPRTTIDLDEAVEIAAIRVRCTTGAKQWWQVYELIAGEKGVARRAASPSRSPSTPPPSSSSTRWPTRAARTSSSTATPPTSSGPRATRAATSARATASR